APNKPIFVDDMWSIMFTTTQPFDGFAQFIGADSMEGDFPIASIPSYQALEDQMNNGDSLTVAWYNAKTARKAVKNFVTAFGEGAERVCFSMTNDPNPQMPFYDLLTGPWRWSGMMGHKNTQYQPKPVFYTMKLLVEKLHDFTSVTQVPVSNNPYTRVYRFERERGTACLIAWSEVVNNPVNPAIPNGETVDIPVNSDSLLLTEIITEANITQGNQSWETSISGNFSVQLGFTPVILEETQTGTGMEVFKERLQTRIYPNPTSGITTLYLTAASPQSLQIELLDIHGKGITRIFTGQLNQGQTNLIIDLRAYVAGIYFLRIVGKNVNEAHKIIKVD
ncbi:MAG: T9SS type A sorting domain-containing protein, partial [Bacteroidetes bacterium]|nr:T9SS type A sorting domain-containing protein [Bacteroidota bacterium]